MGAPPVLFLDVDGVISLYGFTADAVPAPLSWIDGMAHCIPEAIGGRLVRLAARFELVWATGWEHRANDLPAALELPFDDLPWLGFEGRGVFGSADWKVDAIAAYAGNRPAAWVDDNLDETCRAWAAQRAAPTLLVDTESSVGLTEAHVELLVAWADELRRRPSSERGA